MGVAASAEPYPRAQRMIAMIEKQNRARAKDDLERGSTPAEIRDAGVEAKGVPTAWFVTIHLKKALPGYVTGKAAINCPGHAHRMMRLKHPWESQCKPELALGSIPTGESF